MKDLNYKNIMLKCLYLIGISVFSFILLELGLRDFKVMNIIDFISNHKKIMMLSLLVMFMLVLLFSLIFNNLWLTGAFFIYSFIIIAFATHLKIRFRIEPVFPTDIALVTSLKELIEMVEIKYMILFIVLSIFVGVSVYLLSNKVPFRLIENRKNHLPIILVSCALLLISTHNLTKVHADNNKFNSAMNAAGFKEFRWDPLRTYHQNGFVLGFISNFSGEAIRKPAGYSKEKVEETLKKYENATELRNKGRENEKFEDISVVFILSESLSDPRNLNGIELDESPIPFIQDTNDKYTAGKLIVPAYGGGTPNTEYEILTGFSIQDLESNMALPFQRFLARYKTFPSFVNEYKRNEGNKAISLHSFNSKMFKRRDVYKTLGFDESYFEDDMEHTYKVDDNKFISDAASYEEVIDYLTNREENTFTHLVTIQNHAVYSDKYKEYKQIPKVRGDENMNNMVKYYTQGIYLTDQETEKFINKISTLDKKVAVVLYGDHHPGLYNSLSDINNTFEYATTDFFIYTNFNDKKVELKDPVSSTNIINHLYDASDVKVNAIHQLIWELRKEIPAGKGEEYLLKDGVVAKKEDLNPKQMELLDDYNLIQYDIIEGKGYSQVYLRNQGW